MAIAEEPTTNTLNRALNVAMFPWFAWGHITPYLHLANTLAARGHRTTLLLPHPIISQNLQSQNLHPNLITFFPLTLPRVTHLPESVSTASEIPISANPHLATALDLTRPQVEGALSANNFDVVLYDMACWVPSVAARIGIKSVCYNVVSAASIAIALVPGVNVKDLGTVPYGYPSKHVVLKGNEKEALRFVNCEFGSGMTFYERIIKSMQEADAIAMRTCREMEGHFCDYIQSQYKKRVFLTGPILRDQTSRAINRWNDWLSSFKPGSVIFCAFGTQFVFAKHQFHELLLGLELTGRPFLVAARVPSGSTAVEESLPNGFSDRTGRRGAVDGGWVEQVAILKHPSVGCFLSHCGFGSMWEGLMSECRMVVVPQLGDQILNARMVVEEMGVAMETTFDRDDVRRKIECVMDEENEVGKLVRKKHDAFREKLARRDLMDQYVDDFVEDLQKLSA